MPYLSLFDPYLTSGLKWRWSSLSEKQGLASVTDIVSNSTKDDLLNVIILPCYGNESSCPEESPSGD